MTFQKGHKLATGRPKGSLNKLTKSSKNFLKKVLFNEEEFINDYNQLDLNGRMELRIKLAPYLLPKAKSDNEILDEIHIPKEDAGKSIYKHFGMELPEDYEGFNFNEWSERLAKKYNGK